jgi:Ca2+-binding EF-hand superfamily protein
MGELRPSRKVMFRRAFIDRSRGPAEFKVMLFTLLLPLLIGAQAAVVPPPVTQQPVVVTGRGGVPFITPMGEPIRARTPNEDTLARWFAQVDLNHDGYLTPDELRADADRYFAILDSNGDGQIDPDELVRYEWRVAPEIQVNSRLRKARAPGEVAKKDEESNGRENEARTNLDKGLQGAARYGLLNLPEPVAAADADLNRAITLQEFRQAALDRFALLDTGRRGRLSLQDLEAIRTAALANADRKKRKQDAEDTRVGVPLPPGP